MTRAPPPTSPRTAAARSPTPSPPASPTPPPGYVFAREDGTAYHPDFVTKHFDLLVRRTGLPRIRLHDLRHTHATLGLAAGIPAKVMADRLGHSSVMLTLDTYSHVTPAMDHAAADLIAGLVEAPPERFVSRLLAAGRLGRPSTEPDTAKDQVRRGAPPGTRTPNPRIKSPLLCH